jgi:hypothetical protein
MVMEHDNTTFWKRKKLVEPLGVVELLEGTQMLLIKWENELIVFGSEEKKVKRVKN